MDELAVVDPSTKYNKSVEGNNEHIISWLQERIVGDNWDNYILQQVDDHRKLKRDGKAYDFALIFKMTSTCREGVLREPSSLHSSRAVAVASRPH